jgi:MFS family permease
VYLGGGLGYLSGAINTAIGWRWTFLILGIPGFVLLALLIVFFRDPRRAQSEGLVRTESQLYTDEEHAKVHTIRESIAVLISNVPFVLICIASSIRMFSGYALGAWLATFYERRFDLNSSQFGPVVGVLVIFGGSIGSLAGGYLSDRLMSYTPAAKAYVIAASQFISAPFIAGVFLATEHHTSFALLFFAYLTGETWLGPAAAVVQDVMPARIRALSIATYTTVNTLIGGLGPLAVGSLLGSSGLCTRQYGERHGVQYALLYLMPICYVVSSIGFVAVGWALRRQTALAQLKYAPLIANDDEDKTA